jgi:hypothetical protein
VLALTAHNIPTLCMSVRQSPEDIELRDKLTLMVERAKDADAGVAKSALDSMR